MVSTEASFKLSINAEVLNQLKRVKEVLFAWYSLMFQLCVNEGGGENLALQVDLMELTIISQLVPICFIRTVMIKRQWDVNLYVYISHSPYLFQAGVVVQ